MPFATANRAMGAVAASQQLTIQVWLKPRTAAAESYATAVSTPGSALYQHYLSPAAYAARFGASKAAAAGGRVVAQVRRVQRRRGRLGPGLCPGDRAGVDDQRGV